MAPEKTERLARAQFASLRRLASLPDHVAVWPTHGPGSFCSAQPGAERTSTIGREMATNPLLSLPTEDAFVEAVTGSLGSYPAYFHRLPEINRLGPPMVAANRRLLKLSADAVAEHVACGAQLIDTRAAALFAQGHVPGSLSIPLRASFATWLGWLVAQTSP